MITEFKVAGWWRESEAAGAAEFRIGAPVQAETEDGKVRIIGNLDTKQVAVLRDYFENHPEQEMPEREQAASQRRKELVARVRKVTDDPPDYSDADLRDAIGALAELAGVKL